MRNNILYSVLTVSVLLSFISCKQDSPVGDSISFVTQESLQTKGIQKLYYTSADKIGVIAVNPDTPSADPYMNNVQLSTSDGRNWTYSPERLWPDYDLSFFASYPYLTATEGANGLSLTSVKNKTVLYHTPADITKHDDFMTASTNVAFQNLKRGSVKLNMRHRLSCIHFVLAQKVSKRLILTKIEIKGIFLEATFYPESLDLEGMTGNISYPETGMTEFFNNASGYPKGTNVIPDGHGFMLPPQNLDSGANPSVDIHYRIDSGGEDFCMSIPLTGVWKEGRTYNYNLIYDGRNFAVTLTDFVPASWN